MRTRRVVHLLAAMSVTGLALVAAVVPAAAIQDSEMALFGPIGLTRSDVVFGRVTLRAEIVGFNPQPDPPGHWFATLEVFHRRTGRTSVLLGGPDTLPIATPAP